MNRRQKLVQERFLDNEEAVIHKLKNQYHHARKEIEKKAKALQDDINRLGALADLEEDEVEKARLLSMQQAKVYQKQYQDALKKQVGSILDNMQVEEFRTVSEYLQKCYEDGFIGTMYDLQGQGIPLCFPLDQEAMVRAIQLDSKISQGLYSRLGEDVALLKKKITAQVSRGIATGMSFQQVAKQLSGITNIGYNNAVRIARTEGHRIQVQGAMDACYKAKDKGADVVKQWDATLDGRTRESHQAVDGEIRELDEKFSNGLMFPGDPAGGAAEVVNCRCALLQRARWALDEEELQTLKERAAYFGIDKSDEFNDFKGKYLNAVDKSKKYNYDTVKANASSGQSRQRSVATKEIISRGIKSEKPIYADGKFGKFVAKVQPEEGFYDVALHGNPVCAEFFGKQISSQTLAKIIAGRSDYDGGAVRLLSCETGDTSDSENCFAQRLADALGVDVKAPNKILWTFPDGKITVGDTSLSRNGEFVVFKPRKGR